MRSTPFRYFSRYFGSTGAGLILAFWIGWSYGGRSTGFAFLIFAMVLAILEVPQSFVSANKLKTMQPRW